MNKVETITAGIQLTIDRLRVQEDFDQKIRCSIEAALEAERLPNNEWFALISHLIAKQTNGNKCSKQSEAPSTVKLAANQFKEIQFGNSRNKSGIQEQVC